MRAAPWVLGALLAAAAPAEVLMSRSEALFAAFGDAHTTPVDHFLTDEQVYQVETHAGDRLESPLVTIYEARRGQAVIGYGVFDTRTIRSHTATILTVLTPSGSVERAMVCAFHEPQEYRPPPRWMQRLGGRGPAAPLQVGDDLAALSGATMSTRSAAASVRRARALLATLGLAEVPRGAE